MFLITEFYLNFLLFILLNQRLETVFSFKARFKFLCKSFLWIRLHVGASLEGFVSWIKRPVRIIDIVNVADVIRHKLLTKNVIIIKKSVKKNFNKPWQYSCQRNCRSHLHSWNLELEPSKPKQRSRKIQKLSFFSNVWQRLFTRKVWGRMVIVEKQTLLENLSVKLSKIFAVEKNKW